MPTILLFRKVYSDRVEIDQPERIATPYGGRLIWTMPGENKITVHLKDSAKIRHKKRWSQVGCFKRSLGNLQAIAGASSSN
jgi:hypothetical protein